MFDNNLKFCREELEMTQEELGNILNVSRKTISGWETSNDPIPFIKLVEFCNLYNYSLDFVTGLSRKSNKHNNNLILDKKHIGKNLKKFRKSLNLSQSEFSNRCGISQTTYSHYESGLNLITTTNIYIICKTYNISIDNLINETN